MAFKNHSAFYNDPDLYDEVLDELYDFEDDFYKTLAVKYKKILYLGSGSGRLLKFITPFNKNVTCVELSTQMIKKSRKLYPKARFLNQDALKLGLKEHFDLIIAPYEFLNHFSKAELKTLFMVIKKHLADKGVLAAALKNPYHFNQIKDNTISRLTSAELKGNVFEKSYETFYFSERRYVDFIERVNQKTGDYTLINMEWYFYFDFELSEALKHVGIAVKSVYGSFDKKPLRKASEIMLLIAQNSSN